MAKAQALIMERLGLDAMSRVKTVNRIVEKLGREKTRLSTMQDIAGLRIVVGKGLADQQDHVDQLRVVFPNSHLYDRRVSPSHGYRAVHVIVGVDGFPVEVQVRTKLQHGWAETMEKLADRLGRGIRYGWVPEQGGEEVRKLLVTSEFVRVIEEAADHLLRVDPADRPAQIKELEAEMHGIGDLVRMVLDSYEP